MYKFLLAIFLIITVQTHAQSYVLDIEKYLSAEEVARVDSMLAEFHKRTGNVVLMSTDSLNIQDPLYKNELFSRYYPDSTSSQKVMMLILSRKNQLVQITMGRNLQPFFAEQRITEMIFAGAPALQAKRREEGVTIILRKAMEALGAL
jgi:uncharacterized membrane protein YgcG